MKGRIRQLTIIAIVKGTKNMAFSEKKSVRPIIKLPFTSTELILECIAVISLIFMIGTLISSWSSISEVVPKHFGPTGEIDAWGNKKLLYFPITPAVIIYIFLSVLTRFPHIYNYPVNITEENAERQYRTARTLIIALKTEIVLIFIYIQWTMISKTKALFLPVFLFILLGTLCYFVYRSYKLK